MAPTAKPSTETRKEYTQRRRVVVSAESLLISPRGIRIRCHRVLTISFRWQRAVIPVTLTICSLRIGLATDRSRTSYCVPTVRLRAMKLFPIGFCRLLVIGRHIEAADGGIPPSPGALPPFPGLLGIFLAENFLFKTKEEPWRSIKAFRTSGASCQ